MGYKKSLTKILAGAVIGLGSLFYSGNSNAEDVLKTYVDPVVRKNYLNDLERHNSRIKELCSDVNADFFTVSNDEDVFDVFYKILN